jgi:hypothetical protein
MSWTAARTALLHRYRSSSSWFLPVLVLPILAVGGLRASAGVIQSVSTSIDGSALAMPESDDEEIFKLDSADITSDIHAQIGQTPGSGYTGAAGAGRFGQIGLRTGIFRTILGAKVSARVVVASDEFVNPLGVAQRVRTQFIIDGGEFIDPFSTNNRIAFSLEVGGENRGMMEPVTDAIRMKGEGSIAAAFGGTGGSISGFNGGSYFLTWSTDAMGAKNLSISSIGGLDLHAAVVDRNLEIPLSLQTLELGVLGPGERLLLGYIATIEIEQNGVSEGSTGEYSDPFVLMGDSIRSHVIMEPVPEPVSRMLSALGLLMGARVCRAAKWKRRTLDGRQAPPAPGSGSMGAVLGANCA